MMHPDDLPPFGADPESGRLLREGLDPVPLPPARREAVLRRILKRTGEPLDPAPDHPPAPAPD